MFNINFNLMTPDNKYISVNHLGGSKPPPYLVVVCTVSFATAFGCLSLTMQLLLFRKNHARLACSVVNALTTARCRYQLLRIADRGKPCPYGIIYNSVRAKHPLLFTLHFSLFSARQGLCPFCSATLRKRWTNGFKPRGQCVGRTKKQD